MAVNDGIGNPVQDPFPGIALPSGTGLPGSQGSRTPGTAADISGMETGIPGVGIGTPLAWQLDNAGAASTEQRGQNDDGLTGVTTEQISESGAGEGHCDAWHRYPWQQSAGA